MAEHSKLQRLVIEILSEEDKEKTGHDIFRELCQKGIKTWANHVYTMLTKMEAHGLLKGRWVENTNRRGPRKHLYRLSRDGQRHHALIVKESIQVLMGEFVRTNSNVRDLADHINGFKSKFALSGRNIRNEKHMNIVMAIPSYDPLICHPISISALCEAFPGASVVVIKPSEMIFKAERNNLKLLDGFRYNMPLRDGFADYLVLEGFPREASFQETISECKRVLKQNGSLLVQISEVMIEERRPAYVSFAEFVAKKFYETCAQDRMVSLRDLKSLLMKDFHSVTEARAFGIVAMWGAGLLMDKRKEKSWSREMGRGNEITVATSQ